MKSFGAPEKQMAQRLGWAILLTIKRATCLIMLDRSTYTHQHRSGPDATPAMCFDFIQSPGLVERSAATFLPFLVGIFIVPTH